MRRVVPLLVLALLAACSSSGSKDTATPGTTTGPTTAASTATSARPGATATAAASAGSGPSSAAATTGGGSTGAVASTGSATKPSASSGPRSSVAKGTPAGSYAYDSSGTQTIGGSKQAVSNSSTLEVSEVIDGSQSSTLHNSQGDTTQSLLVRDNGSFLRALQVKGPGLDTRFSFDPPALLLGDPAKVGATWSWSGTSSDGATTVRASNKVLRTETVTIGGQRVATVVLQTHLVITGKDFSYTADTTNWVAPALRLPVKTHTVGSGKYGFVQFAFDVTDVIRSLHPA